MLRRVGLGFLNAALDLPHGFEVMTDFGAVARSELSIEPSDIFVEPVEQAGLFPQRGLPICHAAAFSEQTLENDPRMRLRRQRRCRRRPGKIVLVNAGVTVV